jgi:hypothetical protein
MAGPSPAKLCEEKARLLRENAKAMDDYFQATIRELERRRATYPTMDYEQLAEAVSCAKQFAEQARRALQRHVVSHGC